MDRMKRTLIFVFVIFFAWSCKSKSSDEVAGEAELASLSYTLYTDSTELFVEFKPLVVGETSRFAAHLTRLGENFTAYTEGNVTVSLLQDDKGLKNSVDSPSSPGIFRLALKPVRAGMGKLVFDIEAPGIRDQLTIDSIEVYPDIKSAIAAQPEEVASDDISYLKEQAWKVEFANAPVRKGTMFDVVSRTDCFCSRR
jgi:membrane fusion protein, heavy metal efflux system